MDFQDDSVLSPGTRIDQYVITGLLGRGGFGITYLVYDEALRKDFALKEFFPEDFVSRENASTRVKAKSNSENEYRWGLRKFYDEARLLVQFSHPNIVGVRRVFEANNSAYMLLDLIKGNTLEKWLLDLKSAPTQEELDFITGPLLSALHLAHENRTWHLDISPDNVMIRGADGAPILLDFGASRFEIKQRSQVMSVMVYKSGYSAPEQYTSNANRYGPWTDIYAVGATLYRAVAGTRPIEAPVRQLGDEQKPVAAVAKERYRPNFLQAIDWALKLAPEERPQSVAEWRKVLLDPKTAPLDMVEPTAKVTRSPLAGQSKGLTGALKPAAPTKSSARWILLAVQIFAAVLGVSLLAMQDWRDWRCVLFRSSCPALTGDGDIDQLQACLNEKRKSLPCTARACLAAHPGVTQATPGWSHVEEVLTSVEKVCRDEDDAAARRARECADVRQSSSAACEIATACLAPYLADYPNGRARSEFAGRAQQAARDCESASASVKQAEDRLFDSALACAAASDGCKASVCFQAYLNAHPSGRYLDRVQAEIAKARCVQTSGIPNGVYLARTQQGCDGGAQSVRITVADGRIAWQHDAQGTTFQWEGTIDGDGELRATVRGVTSMHARGRWHGSRVRRIIPLATED